MIRNRFLAAYIAFRAPQYVAGGVLAQDLEEVRAELDDLKQQIAANVELFSKGVEDAITSTIDGALSEIDGVREGFDEKEEANERYALWLAAQRLRAMRDSWPHQLREGVRQLREQSYPMNGGAS